MEIAQRESLEGYLDRLPQDELRRVATRASFPLAAANINADYAVCFARAAVNGAGADLKLAPQIAMSDAVMPLFHRLFSFRKEL
ncbi:hypothetical protein [Yoonia sp. MH D7]